MRRNDLITTGIALMCAAAPVQAADISVTALFGGKAQIVIDGKPRMLSAGQTSPEGVKLISADSSAAVIEFQGKRRSLALGSGYKVSGVSLPTGASGSAPSVTLTADAQGHYQTLGQVNGGTVTFLVDTGATSIALPSAEARRLGINYLNGQRGYTQTANGKAVAYRITLDTVKVGDITLHAVEAVVLEGDGLKIALLGMSFLNRTEMKRDGQALTLVKRF